MAQTIDPATAITNEEIEEFARNLTFANEPKCEVKPEFHGEAECEHTVHHLLRTCRGQGFACDQAIREVDKSVRAGSICAQCGNPVASDWRYIPI